MFITNISNTTEEGLDVVSTCQGKGDPGYKITACQWILLHIHINEQANNTFSHAGGECTGTGIAPT